MTYLQAVILGLVQGLAEFLPISSSGHLALLENFFGIKASVKLWVKVKEDWRNRQGLIHTFGLDNIN